MKKLQFCGICGKECDNADWVSTKLSPTGWACSDCCGEESAIKHEVIGIDSLRAENIELKHIIDKLTKENAELKIMRDEAICSDNITRQRNEFLEGKIEAYEFCIKNGVSRK